MTAAKDTLRFAMLQISAAAFGIGLLVLLAATHWLWRPEFPIARYDALLLAAVGLQAAMIACGLESWTEARVIAVFHLAGMALEIYKIAQGSWVYPEPGALKVMGAPLFSGFMYAAVGSYIARAQRLFRFETTGAPSRLAAAALALASYANFFTHHVAPDARLWLFAAALLLYRRCWASLEVAKGRRVRSPLLLVFLAVAGLLWIAEAIGVWSGAWVYAGAAPAWTPVAPRLLGSWFLLIMLSFVLLRASGEHRAR